MNGAEIGARELAERAHAHVQQDPRVASAMAREALERARTAGDREAQVAALHALGFAQNALADPAMTTTLRRAVRLAQQHGSRNAEARARLALAGALALHGSVRKSLREIDRATADLDPFERARAEVFRLGLLFYSEEAYTDATRSGAALRSFRARGESIWEARLLFNRGLVRGSRGDISGGLDDLRRARDLYDEHGAEVAVADAEMAIAEALVLSDDIPGALRRLDAVGGDLPGTTHVDLELARSRALVTAMLLEEALVAIETALSGMRAEGPTDRAMRAQLARARILVLAGDVDQARRTARIAGRAFARRGQQVAAARARLVALDASVRLGRVTREELRVAGEDAELLAAAGWQTEAHRANLVVASAHLVNGDSGRARTHLGRARAQGRGAMLADRLLAARVTAQLQLFEGASAAAARTAAGGLDRLDRYRLTLGSVELRTRASTLGQELATLGLRLAVERGNARRLLTWIEKLRANALLARPERHHDPVIVAAQAELRRIERELDDPQLATSSGRRRRRRATLEQEISRRTRHLSGTTGTVTRRPTIGELNQALGGRTLVELVSVDGQLHAVCARDGIVRHRALGALGEPTSRLEWLRFGLRQLAREDLSRARRIAAAVGVTRDLELLDAVLFQPIHELLGDDGLVLAPGADLAALPWAMMPSLEGRAVSVVPSATLWHRLGPTATGARAGVTLVAGPGLRHAKREVTGLARIHRDATVLAGRDAKVAATLASLDGARIAHLATHGHFRADSPLFSAFELADGSLTAHELCALEQPPEVLILSACDLALSDARPGDELLGLAATLLGLGTRAIIASVAPVSDRHMPRLMRSLHEALTAGVEPAAALAAAQRANPTTPATFVCLGRG